MDAETKELWQQLYEINRKLDRIVYLQDSVDKINHILFGENDNPGLIIRTDRLESADKAHKWTFGVALTAFIAIIASLFHHV